jgi:hypothetical protein
MSLRYVDTSSKQNGQRYNEGQDESLPFVDRGIRGGTHATSGRLTDPAFSEPGAMSFEKPLSTSLPNANSKWSIK